MSLQVGSEALGDVELGAEPLDAAVRDLPGVCVYDADRVVRDSRSFVVEARRDRAWLRVGSFTAADVVAVERFVAGCDDAWVPEDVRFAAGVSPPADGGPGDRPPRPTRGWWRRSTQPEG